MVVSRNAQDPSNITGESRGEKTGGMWTGEMLVDTCSLSIVDIVQVVCHLVVLLKGSLCLVDGCVCDRLGACILNHSCATNEG